MAYNTKRVTEQQLAAQRDYAHEASVLLRERFGTPTAYVETYGCQQNESDSELLRGMLSDMGCTLVKDGSQANIIVLNTCAIREHAETRVFGNIGAFGYEKKNRPGTVIAVCGCMAQHESAAEKMKKSYPYVDMVFGPHALWRFP